MFSECQLKIADLYNIPIGGVKKLVPNFFDKGRYVVHYGNLQIFLRLGLKIKRILWVLEFNQSQQLKSYIKFNTQKRIETEGNNGKDGKGLYKLMKNAIYSETMEDSRIKTDVKNQ